MLVFNFDLPLVVTGSILLVSLCGFAIGGWLRVRRIVVPRMRIRIADSEFSGAMVRLIMVFRQAMNLGSPRVSLQSEKPRSRSVVLPALFVAGVILSGEGRAAFAQEMEPRRWTHLPVGTSIAGVGYVYTDGDVNFDPVTQIEDAKVQLHTILGSYLYYFSLADVTARIEVQVPYQSGQWEGLVGGVPTSITRDGLADPRIRFSVSFIGAPALGAAEYREYYRGREENTVVGASLAVRVPLGEYMDDKLINLGENRYSFQPQVGVVHSTGPWSFELTASTTVFTANGDFFGGHRLEQDPLHSVQVHVVRSFEAGFWVSAGSAYGWAGESEIDGVGKNDDRSNLLYGISAGFSVASTHSFRAGYIRQDALEDVGLDVDHFLLTWSMLF